MKNSGLPIRLATLMALIVAGATSTGCFALQSRIEGTNYAAEDAPFIAESAPRIDAGPAWPSQEGLIHRVVLVGDAGVPMESEPVLASLGLWSNVYPDQTTVLFLGDNVYPAGIEEDAVEEGEEILRKQVAATRADRVFIPGNHDWGHLGDDRLLRQQAYLDENDIEFIPRDGCPGPVYRSIVAPGAGEGEAATRGVGAIVFDIDPWYFGEGKLSHCDGIETPEALGARIGELLVEHQDQWLFVGSHHPLRTGGPHGGYTRGALLDFLTGAVFLVFGTLQDTYEEGYREIMAPIEAELAAAPPAFYVAGHDHNLQILEGGKHAGYQIVSGAGATSRVGEGHVTNIEGSLFAHARAGLVVVDIVRTDAGEQALIHVVETGYGAPVFSMDGGAR